MSIKDDRSLTGSHGTTRGRATVEHPVAGLAIVNVHGEHDLSTEPDLTRSLQAAAAHSNVLIDLSDCTFIDSTIIRALIRAGQAADVRAEKLALVIPPAQTQVARTATIIHLAEFLTIYTSREAALASFGHP